MKLLGVERVFAGVERHWLHTGDDGKDRITVETVQDVEPILKANTAEYNSAPDKFGKGDMHKVASIPAVVLEDACRIHNISFAELMDQKTDKSKRIWNDLLNGREFRKFRTRPGYVKVK
jgi:hypothetical protein